MIHTLNKKTLDDMNKYIEKYNLSGPLLVNSGNEFYDNLKYQKSIMYVGQETNGWVNGNNLDEYEKTYKDFLYNCSYWTPYWLFLRTIIQKYSNFNNVLWANSLICGKKDQSGTPFVNDDIKQISLNYLIEIYKHFKPEMLVIVSGPCNPYYEVVKEFLKVLNSELSGLKPTINDCCLQDNDKNIYYTYHPNYLNRINHFDKVSLDLVKRYKNI